MNKNIDIKNFKTAKRYASALSQIAINNIDEVLENLCAIKDIVFNNPEFMNFFSHPIVSLKDKKDVLKGTLESKIDEISMNFINTLLDEGRFGIFKTILELFKKEADLIKNKQRIQVISAISLDDNQKEELSKKLSQKLSKEVVLNYEENKDILGGLVIKFEDKVIDLSLKTKFDQIRKNI